MNLDGIEATLRQRVAEFIAVPGRLRALRADLLNLGRAQGASSVFLDRVADAQAALRITEQRQAAADAKLQPLLAALQAASGAVEKVGAGVSLAALAPDVVAVLSQMGELERRTATLRDQAGAAGYQVPTVSPVAAWVAVAAVVTLAVWLRR